MVSPTVTGIRPPVADPSRPGATPTLAVGSVIDTVFDLNPRAESGFRLRASRAGGERVDKAILTNDPRIRPGVPCSVRINRVRKPNVPGSGYFEAVWHGEAMVMLPEHVWLPDLTRQRMSSLLARGDCILLNGPQGCGKTVITQALAEAMGYEYVYANASSAVEPTDFVARFELTANPAGGTTTQWVKTEMLIAIEEATASPHRRFLVFLDELNRCRESARNALMPSLDATRRLFDPVIGGFRPIPPNVQFVAAVNIGSQFAGTTTMDAATLDRFCPLHLEYPPPAVEADLIRRAVPDGRAAVIKMAIGIASAIRKEPDIVGGVSVRATIDAVQTLSVPTIRSQGSRAQEWVFREAYCGRLDGSWQDAASDAGRAARIIKKWVSREKQAEGSE